MKRITIILTFIALLTGCASELYTPATADSPARTNYVPNITAMQIGQGAQVVGANLPAPYGTLVDSAAALLIAATSFIAYRKNQQATQHSNAAAALASVIATNPTMVQQAISAAVKNDSVSTVQAHVDSANSPV